VDAASITGALANVATDFVADLGLLGIFVLMLLDCALVPIPSEVTMLFAGFSASQGAYPLVAVIAVGTLGNLVGSQLAYTLGFYGRAQLLERGPRWLRMHAGTLDRAERWFGRYGSVSVLVSRMLPLVRTYISLPAGLARMPFGRFCAFTLLGCLPWVLALAVLGNAVGHDWTQWRNHFRYVDYGVLAVAVAAAAAFLARRRRRRSRTVAGAHAPR
jgi:membrane protein DedA with SNARE-associated domain